MRNKRLARLVVVSALISATVGGFSTPANAYLLLGCQYQGASLKWGDYTTTQGYLTAATNSAAAWTNTSTLVVFTKTTTGNNVRIADGNFGNVGFDGVTLNLQQQDPVTYSCSSGHWTETLVTWWNTYYTDSYGSSERQSVMVHELGHALGLDDIHHAPPPPCTGIPIMQGDTATRWVSCGLTTPQSDDVNGVNFLY